jgi:hypothetical protein
MKLPNINGFWADVAAIPQIARGQVWCRTCGKMQRVDGVGAMKHGWPMCCGQTMTINSPEERK